MVNAEVDNAENGQKAVDMVLGKPAGYYDLVLMDVQMPVLNGHDATRKIRASRHRHVAHYSHDRKRFQRRCDPGPGGRHERAFVKTH